MAAYWSRFGLQQSRVQLRFTGISGEVLLSRRSSRELGFTLGDAFYALYWDPGLGTRVMRAGSLWGEELGIQSLVLGCHA